MNTLTCAEMKELERYAIEEVGIPSLVLMENAAISTLKHLEPDSAQKYLLFAGTGNNGADGLAIARHLYFRGKDVEAVLVGDPLKATQEYEIQLRMVRNLHIPVQVYDAESFEPVDVKTNQADLLIDALFGIGLVRPVTGIHAEAIRRMNRSRKPIVSIDIPSGLNGDTGNPMGEAIHATKTVTYHRLKPGLVHNEPYTGKLIVEEIGIPERN